MRTWRIEAWTHPRKGTPTNITDVPFHEAHLADRRDAIVDSHLTIPAYRTDILDLINTADPTDPSTGVSTLLRAFPVDTDPGFTEPDLPDFEFFAARRDEEIGDDGALYVKIAGPDIRAGVDDPKLLPFDYPGTTVGAGKRTTFPDHIWGGNNIAANGDLEGGQTNAVQQVWIVDDADGVTALNGAIDDTTTTINVDTFAGFPGSVPYTIQIDDERLRVTAGHSTLTWTVTRGVDGTTAAAHADDAEVVEVPHGTFTLIFDGEETGNLDWNYPTGPVATADDIQTALQTLPNIIAVDVSGTGQPGDPWEIEFLDPAGEVAVLGGNDAIFGANLAAGLVIDPGGIPTIEGWTHSYHPGTGQDHGTYAAEKVTGEDVFGVGAITGNGSLWVYGSSLYSGAQQIRDVPPGALAQFSVNHRTLETGQTYRFVVRDLNENLVHPNAVAEISPAANTITPLELVDVVIPTNVNKIIVRVGVVGPDGLTRSWFQLDDLVIRLGQAPASKGKIARDLLADLQTDHAPRVRLSWLTHDFTDTVDSAGANWISDALEFTAAWGDRLGTGVLNPLLFDTGGDWDVEPALDGGGLPTVWNLRAWEIGSRGVDRTSAADPHFIIGAGISGGALAFQEPPFTVITVANEEGYFIEVEDADLVTAYGEIDGFLSSKAYRNMTVMAEVANHALTDATVNQLSAQTRITSAGPVPWHDFDKADRVNFSLPGRVDTTHGRTISQIIVDIKPSGDWEAEITASRLFTGIAAAEEGIRLLLERFDKFDRESGLTGGTSTVLPHDPTPAGGARTGAFLHLARLATQSVAVAGEPIAFDVVSALGFTGYTTDPVPGTDVVIPLAGYWDAKLAAGWDSYTAGGSVWLTRTRAGVEATIYPPAGMPTGLWTATDGQVGEWVAKAIPCQAGDILRFYIDADDVDPQDLATAVLTVELVDRIGAEGCGYHALVLAAVPAAYWHLGEASGTIAADATGNGHDGTYRNTPTLGVLGAIVGCGDTAVDFDSASNEDVTADTIAAELSGAGTFTLEAWVKTTATGGGVVMGPANDGSSSIFAYIHWNFTASTTISARHNQGNDVNYTVPGNAHRDGAWHHVVAVFNDTTGNPIKLYFDGALVASGGSAASPTFDTFGIAVARENADQAWFDGTVDEPAVYLRALTPTEILNHYQTGTGAA